MRNTRKTAEGSGTSFREEILRKIREFRLLDDEFMTEVFRENKEAVRLVLRIILGKPELEVSEVNVQEKVGNFIGRNLCVDVIARDNGKLYNIEIQRSDAGSVPARARYHGSLLDATELEKGQDFRELPETYVIFITESDCFGEGLPVYSFDRYCPDIGRSLEDGLHIVYVNGEYRGDDDIGRLMEDFSCTNAGEMNYTELAERVRYLKENKDGENTMMSRAVEEFGKRCEAKGLEKGLAEGRTEGRAEGRAEGRSVGRAEGADRMASLGDLLLKKGRTEDLKRSFSDPAYREQLFKEFGIA